MNRFGALLLILLLFPLLIAATDRRERLRTRLAELKTTAAAELQGVAEPEVTLPVLPQSLEGPIDPRTYILGPSDEILLIMRGPESQAQTLRVLPEGNVILPNVGAFAAAGMTLTEFKESARTALRPFYRNIEIDFQLSKPRSFVVFVLGEVNRPGPVEITVPFRVSSAIAMAGGVSQRGSHRRIEIRKDASTVQIVDLFSFFELGELDQNPMLAEGQNLFIPTARMSVEIIGEVKRTGRYEIIPGETAADLLRFAGGMSSLADRENLMLDRMGADGTAVTTQIGESDASATALRDLDVLIVPDRLTFSGIRPVQVFGGGGRVGTLYVEEGETILEFLPRLWRFTQKFDTESAVLERKISEKKTEYVPFNIQDVLAGDPVGGTVLKAGDIINVPPVEDSVYVTGEVMLPGAVPFRSGLSAERYIGLAGGPTEAGSFNRLSILSREGVERQAGKQSEVYRGETIVVKRKTSKTIGSIFVGLTSLTGMILGIIALTK